MSKRFPFTKRSIETIPELEFRFQSPNMIKGRILAFWLLDQ